MNLTRLSAVALMLLFLLGLTAFAASTVLYTVDEREQAVVLQFGRPVATHTEPGLFFKLPFVQEVRRLPKTLRFWRSGPGEVLEDLPTADGKKIEVSAWAVWRITDPEAFVRTLKTVENGEAAVQVRVRSAIRDVITSHQLQEVVRSTDRELTYSFLDLMGKGRDTGSAVVDEEVATAAAAAQPGAIGRVTIGREQIMELVREKVAAQIAAKEGENSIDRGIELAEVGISNIEFVPQVREAAFARLKTFMESIAASYTNAGAQRQQEILNATHAEVEKILGEGEQKSRTIRGEVDAEVISKYAEAIKEAGDFYEFTRTLEMYQKALPGETRLILTTDNELFGLLKSMNAFEGDRRKSPPAEAPTAEAPTPASTTANP